ncbi:MAG: hypothetical protein P1U32_09230, partial [Legionellaceae bacterium]|nr:hypothetical protein [Legionellaceae bacterium]
AAVKPQHVGGGGKCQQALIESEIVSSLNLTDLSTVDPIWTKEGSFAEMHHNHNPLRVVSYATRDKNSLIKQFQLLEYSDNTYKFWLLINKPSNIMKELLRDSRLNILLQESEFLLPTAHFRFDRVEYNLFERLLILLAQNSRHFSEIQEEFTQHIHPVISATTSAILSRMTIFQNVSNAIPPVSTNQQKLDACNFSENDLTQAEKTQYEKYCCALSGEVMSDPVYDPDFPQYQFERSWILRSLENKKEHPFIRTPLTQDKLVVNTTLKNTIDLYVDEVVSTKGLNITPK